MYCAVGITEFIYPVKILSDFTILSWNGNKLALSLLFFLLQYKVKVSYTSTSSLDQFNTVLCDSFMSQLVGLLPM